MDELLRLLVLADDPLARAGLAALLATLPGCLVVGQSGSDPLAEAAAGLTDTAVDAIIWDMGWEGAARDRDEPLPAGVPVLALAQDAEGAAVAWALGCRGVLTREMDEERLVAGVRAVAAGLVVVAPALAGALVERPPAEESAADIELTPRESEVLRLLTEGLTNKAIAHRLSISDHTVKFHVNAILGKLNAQSRTDAVVRATRLGLISL